MTTLKTVLGPAVPKFCKDCEYCAAYYAGAVRCRNPEYQIPTSYNLVTGHKTEPDHPYCEDVRRQGWRCGYSAKGFSPK